jgi:UbiA prenyltransferase family
LVTKASINNPILKTLVYANVFIALCAAAEIGFTLLHFNIPISSRTLSYIAFVFFSTFLQYNMQTGQGIFAFYIQRLVIQLKFKKKIEFQLHPSFLHDERIVWLAENRNAFLISNLFAISAIIFLCNWLSWTSIYIMVGAEVVSTLYYSKPFNFRKYGFIKPFLVSAIWTISCVIVPLLEFSHITYHTCFFIAAQFLFIAELCVVFDIKDAEKDFESGVYTYANKLGLKFTRLFCIGLIAASGVLYGLFSQQTLPILIESMFLLFCGVLSLFADNKKHTLYYYLLIDGLLLAQAIAYVGFVK